MLRRTIVSESLVAHGDLLRRLIDPARFPAVHASVVAGAWDEPSEYSDDNAKFGLHRVLHGIGMLVDRRTRETADDDGGPRECRIGFGAVTCS